MYLVKLNIVNVCAMFVLMLGGVQLGCVGNPQKKSAIVRVELGDKTLLEKTAEAVL